MAKSKGNGVRSYDFIISLFVSISGTADRAYTRPRQKQPAWEKFRNNERSERENGPALEFPDGVKHWYYKGTLVNVNSQQEFEKFIKLIFFF